MRWEISLTSHRVLNLSRSDQTNRARHNSSFKMENCKKSDLIVEVKTRRRPRFKAGSELSGKVNLVAIDFNEEITEEMEMVELKLQLTSESCGSVDSNECKMES